MRGCNVIMRKQKKEHFGTRNQKGIMVTNF